MRLDTGAELDGYAPTRLELKSIWRSKPTRFESNFVSKPSRNANACQERQVISSSVADSTIDMSFRRLRILSNGCFFAAQIRWTSLKPSNARFDRLPVSVRFLLSSLAASFRCISALVGIVLRWNLFFEGRTRSEGPSQATVAPSVHVGF